MRDHLKENELALQLERIRELEGSMAELNKTLEAVKQREDRYRHIVEDQTEFICRFMPGGIITFANPALHRLTGQAPGSLVGQSFFSFVPSSDRERVEEEIASLNLDKTASTIELCVSMPDDSMHWHQWTIRAVFSKSGRFIEYQSTGLDITDLRETEEALRRSEENYRNLIENVSDGVYKLNAKGYFTFINPISMKRLGVSENNYQSCHYLDFVTPEHHEKVTGHFERVMKGEETQPYELQYKNREGQLRTVEVKSGPLFKNGKVVGLLGISRDITIRKQAEELLANAKKILESMVEERTKELEEKTVQLLESENRYRTIFENTGAATFIIEEDMIVSLLNSEFERVTGYLREEFEGKKKWTVLVPENEVERMKGYHRLRRIDPNLAPRQYDFQMVDKEGLIKDVFVTVDMIPGTKRSVASLLDITDHKSMERQIQESEKRYRTIFETTGTAMAIFEEDMTISLVNHRVENYLGITREQIEGNKKWQEFIPEEEMDILSEYNRMWSINPALAPKSFETRVICKEGIVRDFFATADLIPGTAKRVVSLIDITDQKQTIEASRNKTEELKAKTLELEELNTALKVLLKRREEDRSELGENVRSNIQELILPTIDQLKKRVRDVKALDDLNLVESNLKSIVTPFGQRLSSQSINLTHKEIQIANLIKEGKTTKEIADYLGVSKSAIDTHRYRIRKKLGLINRRINLSGYLSSLK